MPATTPDVNPLVLKDYLLQFGDPHAPDGALNFQKHTDQVTFTPSSNQVTWTGGGGNTHSDVTTATWAVALNHVQDWETEDSLSRFLYENEGAEVPVTFRPRIGSGPSFKAVVVITPGAIGGSVNQYATTSITLGCKGKPELIAAAPAAG